MSTPQPPSAPFQFSFDEEDAIIHSRIFNDDRHLRRVIKRYHTYTHSTPTAENPNAPNDAREAFLAELESFRLALSKSAMICEAEARQVEEYQRERERIDDEHERLIGQIEELKTSLEHAQTIRRRKMEYDTIAEKISTLPSRDELERINQSLENDIAAVRSEHDTQNRTILTQKSSLDGIIAELGSLRMLGKDPAEIAAVGTPSRQTPPLELPEPAPELARVSTPLPIAASEATTDEQGVDGSDDIEMGEVEEDPKSKRKAREDMEEGEATDASSELTDLPDSDD